MVKNECFEDVNKIEKICSNHHELVDGIKSSTCTFK